MASLKALKVRIGSVKSTQKITRAMKTVAAAKLRRAQDAAVAGRPYAERLEAVMASLASKVTISESSPRLLAGTGKSDTHLTVIATSEPTRAALQEQSPRPVHEVQSISRRGVTVWIEERAIACEPPIHAGG